MINEYISKNKEEVDLTKMKIHKSNSGMKQFPIKSYMPIKQSNLIEFRTEVPFPNSKIDDILVWFMDTEKKIHYDKTVEYAEVLDKPGYLDSTYSYNVMKAKWPAG
jgi:hypothetical protein